MRQKESMKMISPRTDGKQINVMIDLLFIFFSLLAHRASWSNQLPGLCFLLLIFILIHLQNTDFNHPSTYLIISLKA